MPLNIFEPRVKFPTFLICPAAPSGPETLQQLVSAAVTLVTRAVNVPSRSFKVPGEDTILNRRLNQVKFGRLAAKIMTTMPNKPPAGYDLCAAPGTVKLREGSMTALLVTLPSTPTPGG